MLQTICPVRDLARADLRLHRAARTSPYTLADVLFAVLVVVMLISAMPLLGYPLPYFDIDVSAMLNSLPDLTAVPAIIAHKLL